MTAVCARSFLGQSGSLTVDRVNRAVAGRLVGSGANVRSTQWALESDTPDGTACVIATTIGPFNIGWTADGGTIPQSSVSLFFGTTRPEESRLSTTSRCRCL